MKKHLLLLLISSTLAFTACNDGDSTPSTDTCTPACNENQTCKEGTCVDDVSDHEICTPACNENQTCKEGTCVDDESIDEVDPCKGVTCSQGTCDEGVCVTDAMKKFKQDDPCDPETFVDFCNGETPVYCDNGIVTIGDTPCGANKCVVYTDTTLARPRKRATCSEVSCTSLDEITTSCEFIKGYGSVVYAKACQRTTRNTLEMVHIDGYYCAGSCDSTNTKCQLTENECHPYEFASACDGQQLTTCYKTSSLHFITRNEFCSKACITVGGNAMCGMAECDEPGARKNICGYADSTDYKDQLDTVCVTADNGKLYQVRTGEYDVCADECNNSTGECE